MTEKLKIKISIADRVYPLTVETTQEEGLRTASKKIDVTIKKFEANYAVRDKQDVLAMCALQFASQVEQKQVDSTIDNKDLDRLKKINVLTKQIDKMSSSKVNGMKESIETLQEEKTQLKNELQETKAIVEYNSPDKSIPFSLEPIVSDSTN